MAVLKERSLTTLLTDLKNWFALKAKTVFSVNGELPVDGDVTIEEVDLANNLTSDKTHQVNEEFALRTSGGHASIESGIAFLLCMLGNRVHYGYTPEVLEVTPIYMPRSDDPDPFTISIDRDTFVSYVSASAIITLTYTTGWSEDPANYGITVSGNVITGDQIQINYTKEDRGTIVQCNPLSLVSTGWNLYDHSNGYARVSHYSDQYGFRIGGTYTSIAFATDPDDANPETITPVDGMFSVPSDGYIIVSGGNDTDTYIINAWSDWTEGYSGSFEPYSETVIDLETVMETYFPYGLMRVGNVRDEINLNTLTAVSRIGRMAYTAENIATAKASGREYEADTDYIYIVKADEEVNTILVDGSFEVDDHGNEFINGTEVPVYVEVLYGNNLKNKLERDVLTISQQTLTTAQQTQVRDNLGAASQDDVDALNNNLTGKLVVETTTLAFTNSQAVTPLRSGYLLIATVYNGGLSSFYGIYNQNYVISLFMPNSQGSLLPVSDREFTGSFVWLKL